MKSRAGKANETTKSVNTKAGWAQTEHVTLSVEFDCKNWEQSKESNCQLKPNWIESRALEREKEKKQIAFYERRAIGIDVKFAVSTDTQIHTNTQHSMP